MSGLRAARSEGYVQELFHEEAQQVCRRAVSLHSPGFCLWWSAPVALCGRLTGLNRAAPHSAT